MTDIALQNGIVGPSVAAGLLDRLGARSIVLVGMMGAGKSSRRGRFSQR
jgi:hypothetical protein